MVLIEELAEAGPSFYVVIDADGYVAAVRLESELATIRARFPWNTFAVRRFAARRPLADGDPVWLVPLRGSPAVAFASDERAAAEEVRAEYARLALAYDEDIDFRKQPVGHYNQAALQRLLYAEQAAAQAADQAAKQASEQAPAQASEQAPEQATETEQTKETETEQIKETETEHAKEAEDEVPARADNL